MSVNPNCKREECKVQQPEEDVGIYANGKNQLWHQFYSHSNFNITVFKKSK